MNLKKIKRLRSFVRKNYNGIIGLNDAFEQRMNLKDDIARKSTEV